MARRKMFFFPDTHFPFASHKALKTAYTFLKNYQPDVVVQVGDLLDMLSASKFPKSSNIIKPKDEWEQGLAEAIEFWETIKQIVPNKCLKVQLMGNHEGRILKRILERAPDLEHIVQLEIERAFSFSGVKTVHDIREPYLIDDVAVIHGHRTKLGDHLKEVKGEYNVVTGHSHRPGVFFDQYAGKTRWELNCGFLGDISQPCFGYTALKRFNNWTLSVAVADNLGPRVIPISV